MPFTFQMPKLSPTMEEGTLVKWHKKAGEFVDAGELLIEVATDKATVEHSVLDEGWIREILVQEGEQALVGQALAVMTEDEKESIEGYTAESLVEETPEEAQQEEFETPTAGTPKRVTASAGAMAQPIFTAAPPLEDYTFAKSSSASRIAASPLAKRVADERGLDISTAKGSGPRGRIVVDDLATAQPKAPVNFGTNSTPTAIPGSFELEPLTPMRQAIARRLQEAKTFIPHFYVTQAVDADGMIQLRSQLKAWGLKVSFNDFIVRASALALRQDPLVNSGFDTSENAIIRFKTVDVAVAVSVDGGLITPIVRHTDYKNLGDISTEIRGLAKKARDGKLLPEEYQGGSFTVSNLGMYGISQFQAIVNPPQAAILAVGGLENEVRMKEGRPVEGQKMTMSLSCDHRVIDGAVAANFLSVLKTYLENPAGLLL